MSMHHQTDYFSVFTSMYFSPKMNKASSSTESLVDSATKKSGGVRFHTNEGDVNTKNELIVEDDLDILAKLDADLTGKIADNAESNGTADTKKERKKKKSKAGEEISDGNMEMNLAWAWFKHILTGYDV